MTSGVSCTLQPKPVAMTADGYALLEGEIGGQIRSVRTGRFNAAIAMLRSSEFRYVRSLSKGDDRVYEIYLACSQEEAEKAHAMVEQIITDGRLSPLSGSSAVA